MTTDQVLALVSAIAAVVSAVAAFGSVYYAWKTIRESKSQVQVTTMSACTQEYFSIRSDAAKDLRELPAGATRQDKDVIVKRYSERVYGLHFEQYHLFRKEAIPCHVYAIWIKSFLDEIKSSGKRSPDDNELYPRLDLDEYWKKYSDKDFCDFFNAVKAAETPEEIEALVREEKKKVPHD